jgi:hypothetical protein
VVNLGRHTNEGQPDQACNADDQAHHVEQEMFVVIHANACVYPRTVAVVDVNDHDSQADVEGITHTDLAWQRSDRIACSACFVVVFLSYMVYRNASR